MTYDTLNTLTSQDILEFVRMANPTGEVRDAFATVAAWMFHRELCKANMFPSLNAGEIEALRNRQKLEAVKLYKRRTGCTLMEAKMHVEEYMQHAFGVTHFRELGEHGEPTYN